MMSGPAQIAVVIKGMYQEGKKEITVGELYQLLEHYDNEYFWTKASRCTFPDWFVRATQVRKLYNVTHEVWSFSDRMSRALAHLERKGLIEIKGPHGKTGNPLQSATIVLEDIPYDVIFGVRKLEAVVKLSL